MAVVQMQRVSICALNKYRKNILEDLQELGWMEIDEGIDAEKEFNRTDTSGARSIISKRIHSVDKALEVISVYAPRPKVKFESMRGKRELEADIYELGSKGEKELSETADRLVEIDRDIVAIKANNARITNQIEELTPWMDLDIPIDSPGTKTADVFVGTIPAQMTERELEEAIAKADSGITRYCVSVVSSSKDMTYVAVVVDKSQEKELEDQLRKIGFSRPSSMASGIPKEAKERLESEIASGEKQIETLTAEVAGLADKWDDLRMYYDYNQLRNKKYEVLGSIPQTKSVFAIEGFMPKEAAPIITEKFTSKYDAIVESRDLEKDEERPVVFKNKWFGRVGEGTVESFGLPNKKEIDPSAIMMVFYVVFFGLMLSDAAYGIILSVGTGIMLLKFPKMGLGMKRLLQLFFLCGFSTLFWGMMFGGYFGDAVDVIARNFFGVQLAEGETIIPALWFVPINNPMRMLIYSLLFGLIHMFTGIALGGYQYLRNKDFMGFFVNTICVSLFILGLVFMLLPTDLFEGIAQMEFNFPPFVGTLSVVMTLVGLLGIILFAGHGTKNFGVRIALGVYEVYNNITGWLSDTLSYSRLLALGLATGVIAQVFNQLGSMFGGGVIGTILFIVIFLIGHVFNLAINVLGAYVHTSRLQYVEFFGKFYEGGGRKFSPFFADTKYVEIKGGQ